MIRYILLVLFCLPIITNAGAIAGMPNPTLVIDNSAGCHTIIVWTGNHPFFIYPSEKKEIEILQNNDNSGAIPLLKGNLRYSIYIKDKILSELCVLNTTSMKEEGDTNCLRIVRELLGKAKL